jgi:hypothetical protein
VAVEAGPAQADINKRAAARLLTNRARQSSCVLISPFSPPRRSGNGPVSGLSVGPAPGCRRACLQYVFEKLALRIKHRWIVRARREGKRTRDDGSSDGSTAKPQLSPFAMLNETVETDSSRHPMQLRIGHKK